MTLNCRQNRPDRPFSRLARRMPRPLAASLALLLGLAAMLALAACGEEDAQLLPGETAREITANLDAVQQLADEGDCTGAEAAAEQVSAQIESIGGVDRRLKQALEDGAERLNEVIAECEESSSEAIAPAIIPEEDEEDEREREGGEGKGKGEKEDGGDGNGPPGDGGDGGGEGEGGGPPDRAEGGPPAGDEDGGEGEDDGEESGEEQSGGVSPGTPAGEGE